MSRVAGITISSASSIIYSEALGLFVFWHFFWLVIFLVGDSCCWQKRPYFPGAGTVTADCRDQQIAIFPHAHRPTCPSSHMPIFQNAIVPHATQNKKMDDVDKGRQHFLTDCTLI
jgi:hypothetical protein